MSPKEINCDVVGILSDGVYANMHESSRRVYGIDGIAPTQHTCGGGNLETKIIEPSAIRMVRTDEGKILRKSYENHHIHHKFNEFRAPEVRTDGCSNSLATVQKDNYICDLKPTKLLFGIGEQKSNGGTQYYQQDRVYDGDIALAHPANLPGGAYMYKVDNTTEKTIQPENTNLENELPFRIRKLTPKECFRLMGFDDIDFDSAKWRTMEESKNYLKQFPKSKVNRRPDDENIVERVSDSQLYKQAGNSIVVDVLENIFMQLL